MGLEAGLGHIGFLLVILRKRGAPMCVLCDGMTPEALAIQTRERIRRNGYTMAGIEGPRPWVYTIGLIENYGHPELVLTGMETDYASELVAPIAEAVRDGKQCNALSVIAWDDAVDVEPVRFGFVHDRQWVHGRFDRWYDHYLRFGPAPQPVALQIIVPGHTPLCQPLLDADPGSNVNATNRAERRSADRRRRRRN